MNGMHTGEFEWSMAMSTTHLEMYHKQDGLTEGERSRDG